MSNYSPKIAHEWKVFAAQLILDECPEVKADPEQFGRLMATLVRRDGYVQSVIWTSVVPHGTEDRTWVRAWLLQCAVPAYAGITGGLDGAHATYCADQLSQVWGD